MNKIGIIVEGEGDKKILEVIINKLGKKKENFRFSVAGGKEKLLRELEKQHINCLARMLHCNKIIILADCDYFNVTSKKIIEKIKEIKERRKDISVELCFATQEIESWLLGCYEKSLKEEPDNVREPDKLLEEYEQKKREDKKFKYRKLSDGEKIANNNELKHFRHSASFKRFEKILQKFNCF